MKEGLKKLEKDYQAALEQRLAGAGEASLQVAYELGHNAVRDGIGLMDIVSAHRKLLSSLLSKSLPEEHTRIMNLAGDLLAECLVPYEITHRGFKEILQAEIEHRKRTEEERDRIFAFSVDMLCIVGFDGYFKRVNPSFERILGWKEEELLARPFIEFIHPGDREQILESSEEHRKGHETIRNESRYLHKDGTYRWISWNSHPLIEEEIIIGVGRDITERKQTEEALRESETKYRNLFENMTEEVHLWKLVYDEHGRIVTWRLVDANPPALITWKKTLDEIKGKTADEIFGTGAAEHYMPVVRKIMTEGTPYSFEDCFPHLDKYFRFTSIPLGDYFITTGVDITIIKKAQKLAEQQQIQLEAANRELESFAYSVSHDLRAPLRAIDGFSQIVIREEEELGEDTKRKLNIIRDNVKKMGQLIDDLLAFSRMGRAAMSFSVINMGDLANQAWAECRTINPGRKMEMKIDILPEAFGDRTLVTQVFSNLLSNAVKFTKSRDVAFIEIGGRSEGDKNVYYLKDNGVGFDMHYYNKLFGVFQRLHSASEYEGTGVGLAIVQRIIHRHGGRVWADGKVNEGATFYFSLPSRGVDIKEEAAN